MKWIAISGSWRVTNQEIENKVRQEIKKIIEAGDGIVTGGALNVDFFATDEAMKWDQTFKQIKIFLPSTLEKYAVHYRKRATEGVITSQQAEELIAQLSKLQNINPGSIIEGSFDIIDKDSYYDRITKIVDASDELLAFQVNNSAGVQDTIDKAKKRNIPVKLYSYEIK